MKICLSLSGLLLSVSVWAEAKDFTVFLSSRPYSDPYYQNVTSAWKGVWNNPELAKIPVFRDCGIYYRTRRRPPAVLRDGDPVTWPTVFENCDPDSDVWEKMKSPTKPGRPMMIMFNSKRNEGIMTGKIELDHGDWRRYRKSHPDLVGVLMLSEWGNNISLLPRRTNRIENAVLRDELSKHLSSFRFYNRYDRLALAKWYADRQLELHYGDMEMFHAERSVFCIDHLSAAWGARYLWLEVSNTGGGDWEYRWDVSVMFTRGAARQFGIPWGLYEASYFNGFTSKGKFIGDGACTYTVKSKVGIYSPAGGTAASAQRRVWYYAYLNGCSGLQSEDWARTFFTARTPTGLAELTPRGKNFVEFDEFTKRHPDRGRTYAPVAILVPFAQGYTAFGGTAWMSCPYTDGDFALDAVFFSIAPGWERYKGLKEGIHEGNLHNSKFAMMYDVLTPDSPQSGKDFARALSKYSAVIVAGDYKDSGKFSDVLAAYERNGGKLLRITKADLPPRTKARDVVAGRVKFPAVEKKLMRLQESLFPFRVSGDCQFGANRTAKGWWLWIFNNKGIRKFADTPETFDRTKDAAVTVDLKDVTAESVREIVTERNLPIAGRTVSLTVKTGDLAVLEIIEKK